MSKLLNRSTLKCMNAIRAHSTSRTGSHAASLGYLLASSSDAKSSRASSSSWLNIKRNVHTSLWTRQEAKTDAEAQSSSNERTVGKPEKFDFLAETKQLLNIVAKSLYSDKEVFIRELISNSSDALEKLKYAQVTGEIPVGSEQNQIPFEIQINANDINNTLTIQVKYFIFF